jgi:hypothetical protein
MNAISNHSIPGERSSDERLPNALGKLSVVVALDRRCCSWRNLVRNLTYMRPRVIVLRDPPRQPLVILMGHVRICAGGAG